MTEKKELEKKETTVSERFTIAVMKEVAGNVGMTEFTLYQKKLSQHLFIKIDATLNELEAKRLKAGKQGSSIAWENMNMQKLAIDVMHRVELGLDALIPNHISPIPYFNSKLKKYDLDLRIGYEGKEYYRREVAIEKPVDIIKELVYKNDTFKPLKRTMDRPVEAYRFDIPNPFDRGEIIGGFAYIKYEDPTKNLIVLVTNEDFKKSEAAGNATFWKKHPIKMKFKTLVNRTMDNIPIDPRKVNASFTAVESDDATDARIVEAEITDKANTGPVMKIEGSINWDVCENGEQGPCTGLEKCKKSSRISQENINNCSNYEPDEKPVTEPKGEFVGVNVDCPNGVNSGVVNTANHCKRCDDQNGCPSYVKPEKKVPGG